MKIENIELIGEKVMLRPMKKEDVQKLYNAGKDKQIWTYMLSDVQTIEQMEAVVKKALQGKKRGTEYPFVIIDRDSNKIVGSTRFLNIAVPHRTLEIGWTWLSPSVWRTKVNIECKYLLLQHCFETLKTIRVQLVTDSRNIRAQQAIERIGAKKEGVLHNHMIMPNNDLRHSVFYSIIQEEWPNVKENLQAMLQK